jgi:uncharacterized protein (DUF58 family)
MIDKQTARTIQRIWFRTRKQVTQVFSGEYLSAFKGQGMEFEEVREYVPGDEVRAIDWNVTARTGRPFVKRFREERELTVMLCVDVSGSQSFGSEDKTKRQVSAEIASVLAYTAGLNSDRVGLLMFSDRIEKYIPPKKGPGHSMRIVRDILEACPEGTETSIARALNYLGHVCTKRAIVFLISDFQDTGFRKHLIPLSGKHDVIAMELYDRCEYELPDVGMIRLRDLETGGYFTLDASSPQVRSRWYREAGDQRRRRREHMEKLGMDFISIRLDRDWFHVLSAYFYNRFRRVSRA